MLAQLLQGAALIAVTVAIHASLMSFLLWRTERASATAHAYFARLSLLMRVAGWCVLAHLLEITVWGAFYTWRGVMPDFEVACYFSAVTYATIGYGDITPPAAWRLLAAIEGLIGILMCAWSGGFIFALVQKLLRHEPKSR